MKKKTRIIIEDGLNLYKKTGQGQYSVNIYNILKEIGYDVEMKRKPFLEKIKNSTIKRILYILWLNTIFPLNILFKKSKMILFTNTITPIFKIPNKKYYPVLHDLWAYKSPETVTLVQKIYTYVVLFSIRNTYEKIITVSETSKKEIVDFLKCNEDDVKVVYNYFSFGENPSQCINPKFEEETQKKYKIYNNKYILSVATLNKRKNIKMLINAYNSMTTDIKLVLVGSASTEKFDKQNNPNIIFTGYVTDDELKVLYKNAFIYAFPSAYEGFGIPIIDAQSFGIPVICSDIDVFHEIAGKAAQFCPLTPQGISEKILELVNNKNLQEELKQMGYQNIKRFSIDTLNSQLSTLMKD